jgi:NADH:ubiquinone oxidoreductase subunit 4 (subunit M)
VSVNRTLPDLTMRERVALWPMAVAAVAMGVIPMVWLAGIDPAVTNALGNVAQLTSQVMGR